MAMPKRSNKPTKSPLPFRCSTPPAVAGAGADIKDKEITADALLTQRKLAAYLVERGAHYYFTVKANQPTLEQDIALHFQDRKQPDFVELTPPDHGRIETRSIWATT